MPKVLVRFHLKNNRDCDNGTLITGTTEVGHILNSYKNNNIHAVGNLIDMYFLCENIISERNDLPPEGIRFTFLNPFTPKDLRGLKLEVLTLPHKKDFVVRALGVPIEYMSKEMKTVLFGQDDVRKHFGTMLWQAEKLVAEHFKKDPILKDDVIQFMVNHFEIS